MFGHVVIGVSDYAASKAFFLTALEPLGATVVSEGPLARTARLRCRSAKDRNRRRRTCTA